MRILFLICFCLFLCLAQSIPNLAGFFLWLDPLVGLAIPLAAKSLLFVLIPTLLLLIATAFFGRFFCGSICPMGTTLSLVGKIFRKKHKKEPSRFPRSIRYLLLALVLTAAVFGTNLIFWFSPIPLVTRLYVLLIEPFLTHSAQFSLEAITPYLGASKLTYLELHPNTFTFAWFTALIWLILLGLEYFAPRFWCQYLCPSGALFGLAAKFAKRSCHKKDALTCIGCGKCDTKHLPTRRTFLASLGCGLIVAATKTTPAQNLVRPPASLPESDFLTQCVRCGACMQICPTNALQPTFLETGLSGINAPVLDPRHGGCRPECVACTLICPTNAIRPLTLEEKVYAKIGTAVIDPNTCLAWKEERRCMVCLENCPYGAITVQTTKDSLIPKPEVTLEKCFGCGFCELSCPKKPAAIKVMPKGAIRIAHTDFAAEAKAHNLAIKMGQAEINDIPPQNEGNPPPGFLE